MGGAGKTTLARQYARQYNADVIWEINGKSKISLLNSYENLACALALNEEEKKNLRKFTQIKDSKEREERTLTIIKTKLKSYKNWLLIFDNIEKFTDIQNSFPSDPKVWGEGKIIITTRDYNIINNSQMNGTVLVGELGPDDKYNLFMKIAHKGEKIALKKNKYINF